jgi:hypothetical protein
MMFEYYYEIYKRGAFRKIRLGSKVKENNGMRKKLTVIAVLLFIAINLGCTARITPTGETAVIPKQSEEPDPTEPQFTETLSPEPLFTITTTATKALPSATPTRIPSATGQPEEWVSVAVESVKVWDDPSHEGDYWSMQTDLITGERVLVTGRQGEWVQIIAVEQPSSKDKRGYPGWVRGSSLVAGWPVGDLWAVVMAKRAQLTASQEPGSKVLMRLHLDTRVVVVQQVDEQVQVRLPDGREGWLPAKNVRLSAGRDTPAALDGFYETAEALIGIPYVWGGTTSDSLDCSGFLYRLFHAYGLVLARDANDQALEGTAVDANALQRGHLIFTADRANGPITHVVMYWEDGQIIDAEPERGVSVHPLSDLLHMAVWSGARAYLP